jgi:serine/threonine protein kinase
VHEQGFAHRDLKPENIIFDAKNILKLADFGFCNKYFDGSLIVTSCGSPNYASPEVINGVPYDGPASDIWSCGVILYATLVGNLPFDSDQIGNLFK